MESQAVTPVCNTNEQETTGTMIDSSVDQNTSAAEADTEEEIPIQLSLLLTILPYEIRHEIWRLSLDPRVIEVRSGGTFEHPHQVSPRIFLPRCGHATINVVPDFRRAPAILHICHDSRLEGLKYYKKITFDIGPPVWYKKEVPATYYAPSIDTIYFGKKACIGAIASYLHNRAESAIFEIPRIAVSLNSLSCINNYPSRGFHLSNNVNIVGVYNYDQDVHLTLLKVLQGRLESIQDQNAPYEWRRCRGLQEISFVFPRTLLDSQQEKVDSQTVFINTDQVEDNYRGCSSVKFMYKRQYLREMAQSVNSGTGAMIPSVLNTQITLPAQHLWIGQNHPSVKITKASFPAERIKVQRIVLLRFGRRHKVEMFKLAMETGVKAQSLDVAFEAFPAVWYGRGDYAFKMFGKPEDVRKIELVLHSIKASTPDYGTTKGIYQVNFDDANIPITGQSRGNKKYVDVCLEPDVRERCVEVDLEDVPKPPSRKRKRN